jgi:hypothetical protein
VGKSNPPLAEGGLLFYAKAFLCFFCRDNCFSSVRTPCGLSTGLDSGFLRDTGLATAFTGSGSRWFFQQDSDFAAAKLQAPALPGKRTSALFCA